jgi:NADH-ubiquinone oxidoreductase chain 6
MNNLFILYENFTNGYTSSILDIISILIILCGVLVIISKNPIISVLYLIGLFASISSYLILIGLSFIGLSYLIVYIGAISILFLFILMLINIRISELHSNTSNSIPLGIILVVFFNSLIFQILPYNIAILNNPNLLYNKWINNSSFMTYNNYFDTMKVNENKVLYVSDNIWDGNLLENSHIISIGNIMYTNYNIWLIITSFILLLAMVGAIIITIKSKN